jgi:hypothetical protein
MTSASGAWSDDVSSGSIRGGANIDVTVRQTAQISFHRGMRASKVFCFLGGNYCDIFGFPFQTLTLKVTHAGTTYTFTGRADTGGFLAISLLNSSGNPIVVKAGDQVQGTNVALYTEPTLTFNPPDFANDIVSGKAPANRFFIMWITPSSQDELLPWVGSNSSGVFSVDTTASLDLVDTETLRTGIVYINKTNGNDTAISANYAP